LWSSWHKRLYAPRRCAALMEQVSGSSAAPLLPQNTAFDTPRKCRSNSHVATNTLRCNMRPTPPISSCHRICCGKPAYCDTSDALVASSGGRRRRR
jgi:thiamine monophosphate kinase